MIRRLCFDSPARTPARPALLSLLALVWITAGCGDGDVMADGGLDAQSGSSVTGRCGDGTQSASEQCDDGNTNAGDGCSSTCAREGATPGPNDAGNGASNTDAGAGGSSVDAATSGGGDASMGGNRSDAGELDASDATASNGPDAGTLEGGTGDDASGPATPEPLCPAEPPGPCEACNCSSCREPIDACSNLAGDATEGPGAGTSKATLCEAVVRCGRQKGCRGIECLCGADPALTPDCLTEAAPPTGPCKDEVLRAAETTVVLTFINRASDPAGGYAIAAAKAVSDCASASCTEACAPASSP